MEGLSEVALYFHCARREAYWMRIVEDLDAESSTCSSVEIREQICVRF